MPTIIASIARFFSLPRCPFCGGKVLFNLWWLIDVDTHFYCRKCRVTFVKISALTVIAMTVFAIKILYSSYQTKSAAHDDVASYVVIWSVLLWAAIALVRLVLLFVLFKIKFPSKKKPPADLWWEPFTDKRTQADV
jgi:hypothetical protein